MVIPIGLFLSASISLAGLGCAAPAILGRVLYLNRVHQVPTSYFLHYCRRLMLPFCRAELRIILNFIVSVCALNMSLKQNAPPFPRKYRCGSHCASFALHTYWPEPRNIVIYGHVQTPQIFGSLRYYIVTRAKRVFLSATS